MGLTIESQQRIKRACSDFSDGTLSGPDQLFEAFYPELKRLAAAKMRREPAGHTLQPTALVNELYLELLKVNALRSVKPNDSRQKSAFFALAGQVMRWLLIRHTRRLSWHAEPVEFPSALADSKPSIAHLLEVEGILNELAAIDPQLRTVVELRVFEGLSIEECSERLECSVSTVTRNWRYAKLWLRDRLNGGEPSA
ncbi:MAG TPA: ECF-type sigma factor [Bryobacteraceae bacterium]|jgi:RNA polymerase sigma factor (TIGR02999 family)|nr:ECF-type sigma factor [Bryobacteraceae bacterium]